MQTKTLYEYGKKSRVSNGTRFVVPMDFVLTWGNKLTEIEIWLAGIKQNGMLWVMSDLIFSIMLLYARFHAQTRFFSVIFWNFSTKMEKHPNIAVDPVNASIRVHSLFPHPHQIFDAKCMIQLKREKKIVLFAFERCISVGATS